MDTPPDAGFISFAFLLLVLVPILVSFWWSVVRIIWRAGYRGWWSLVLLIPIVNIIFVWIFAFSEWPRHKPAKANRESTRVKRFSEGIGDVKLAKILFGDKDEITWLKDTDWDYSRMTLTRDGKIDWKDEDKYDHDTTYFSGTYTLVGTEAEFTVIGLGEARAYYDAYKETQSRHHEKAVTRRFDSSRFTGEGFTTTYK